MPPVQRKQEGETCKKRQRSAQLHDLVRWIVGKSLWKDFIVHLDNWGGGGTVIETKKTIKTTKQQQQKEATLNSRKNKTF